MAKVRQARRCRAKRTNGEPCKAYAVLGATVCRAHGAAAAQVRHAAYEARCEAWARRYFNAIWERHLKELREWQVQRFVTVSLLTGIAPEDITTMDIVLCHLDHGRPDLEDDAPKLRPDKRFKFPQPPRTRP